MSSVGDRLGVAWGALVDVFLGRKAVKTIDACAMYWGVVVRVASNKVDVQLDTDQIASPSNVPLYLGFPGSSVTLVGGERVLVGFRNGDPTQPFAIAFEFNATVTEIDMVAASAVIINAPNVACGPVGTIPVLVVGSIDSNGAPVTQLVGCTNALKAG